MTWLGVGPNQVPPYFRRARYPVRCACFPATFRVCSSDEVHRVLPSDLRTEFGFRCYRSWTYYVEHWFDGV
jgi:hypothetical protein